MRFGYSTNAFVKVTLAEAIKQIAGLGFGGVEIMADRPHLYPPDWDDSGLEHLRDLIAGKGLRVTNLNSFTLFAVGDTYLPSWIEPDQARRDIRTGHTKACLKLASYLGCANISVPPGGPLQGMSRGEAMRLFHRGIEEVVPLAEELGVKILVEPEPDLLLENTREFSEFIGGVSSPCVGINFDIGHFFCAGEDPGDAFEELFPWIGHVHIEDIAPTRRHHHLIPGLGTIDFPKVFRAMQQTGYGGDISLELYTYADMPCEAGMQSLGFLLRLFEDAGFDVPSMLGDPTAAKKGA
jgi:sugar phosphate isomerase/epimerase